MRASRRCQGCGHAEGDSVLTRTRTQKQEPRTVIVSLELAPFIDLGLRLLCRECAKGAEQLRRHLVARHRTLGLCLAPGERMTLH